MECNRMELAKVEADLTSDLMTSLQMFNPPSSEYTYVAETQHAYGEIMSDCNGALVFFQTWFFLRMLSCQSYKNATGRIPIFKSFLLAPNSCQQETHIDQEKLQWSSWHFLHPAGSM
jgi:hypothetical protein